MQVRGIVRAKVPQRGIEDLHIIYDDPGDSRSYAIKLDSSEALDKKVKPGDEVQGTVSWKYHENPYKGCHGIIERGTLIKFM